MYRAHFRVTTVAALLSLAVAGASPLAAQSKDSKQDKKLQEAQRLEIQGLMLATDQAMTQGAGEAGAAFALTPDGKKTPKLEPATDPAATTFRHDLLKAQQGKIYVPFTVTIEPGKLGTNSVAMYVRVAPKGAAVPTEEERKKADKDHPIFTFEDVYFVDLKPLGTGLPPALSRAFAVPAGDYDVYVAVKPQVGEKELPKGTVLPVTVAKHSVTVPDFWNGELTTSTIMLADKIGEAPQQLAPNEQREHPYVLGGAEITPAVDSKFAKGEELLILFQIYNPALDEAGKPDVTVEYEFHRKDGEAEKLFNKMNPQEFNAKTLPPNFDPKLDHQVAAGWGVPLATFPAGDYRLHIKVKDNKAAKEITRDVNFSVSGS